MSERLEVVAPPAQNGRVKTGTRLLSVGRRALSHGAYARIALDRLEAKVAEVFEALGEDAPLRGPDGRLPAHDAVQVRLLAECLCRLDDIGANIREYGLRDQKTKAIRPAVEIESKLRREAADYLDAMGMTPRSRAKLGLDLQRGFDVALDWAEEGEDDGAA